MQVDRNIEKMIYGISLTAGTLPCRKGIPEGDMDLVVVKSYVFLFVFLSHPPSRAYAAILSLYDVSFLHFLIKECKKLGS